MIEIDMLIGMCKACGAEKLPGRLAGNPSRRDILEAIAYLRGELKEIAEVIDNLAPPSGKEHYP
jgi:hypothetical protein